MQLSLSMSRMKPRKGRPVGTEIFRGHLGMNENETIYQLEELVEGFGIKIRYEPFQQEEDLIRIRGGLCLLRGEYVLIINSKASLKERMNTLAMALKHFDLSEIYVRPVLRELLDRIPEQSPFNPPPIFPI